MSYTIRKTAALNTPEFQAYIEKDGKVVSPFHDIPLYANDEKTVYNMVVEAPRWTNAKMKMNKETPMNPVFQDKKGSKLRYARNVFPHHGFICNMGFLSQTWEDPTVSTFEGRRGDNDPIDVCEISQNVSKVGEVKQVKVLGIMALVDEGETDWKGVAIDVNDPHASKLNDIEDVERTFPGLLRALNEWFRVYKIPEGKSENIFMFSGEVKSRSYAENIIRECHEAWEKLLNGKAESNGVSLVNTTHESHAQYSTPESLQIPEHQELPPAPIDPSIDKWFFISGSAM